MADPYAELVALAEHGRDLARDGRLTELAEHDARWWAHVAGLPASPPPSAREALERAHALCTETAETLLAARGVAAEELRRVRRAREVRAKYLPSLPAHSARFDRAG